MTRLGARTGARVLFVVLGLAASANAQIQMPDPSLIHGKALPARDLQTGTVTVRVVRESIGNDIIGQAVTMTVGGNKRTATTDAQGRAEFKGLPVGANARAGAIIDGESLMSDPLVVPASGGLRVILVAGLAKAAERRKQDEAAAAAAPPARGAVILGGNSRIVFEFPDDLMRVYYMLDVINNARTRVDIGGPLIIDLPSEAAGAFTLEGSSKQVTVGGTRITVTGPFASGVTPVQVGFQLPFSSAAMTVTQTWPVPIEQVSVASQKLGTLKIASAQFSSVGDVRADDGTSFILGSGSGLPAAGTLTIQIDGLPVQSSVPKNVALALAAALIGWGLWVSWSVGSGSRQSRERLMARREALLGDLARLEGRTRSGASESAKDAAQRQRLLAELERIFGELDEASPRGGEGLVA